MVNSVITDKQLRLHYVISKLQSQQPNTLGFVISKYSLKCSKLRKASILEIILSYSIQVNANTCACERKLTTVLLPKTQPLLLEFYCQNFNGAKKQNYLFSIGNIKDNFSKTQSCLVEVIQYLTYF